LHLKQINLKNLRRFGRATEPNIEETLEDKLKVYDNKAAIINLFLEEFVMNIKLIEKIK
jgi:hypothetical protein